MSDYKYWMMPQLSEQVYVYNTWWTIETIVMQILYMIWHFDAFVSGLISATLFPINKLLAILKYLHIDVPHLMY